jgi:hypothetical protein
MRQIQIIGDADVLRTEITHTHATHPAIYSKYDFLEREFVSALAKESMFEQESFRQSF